MPDGHQLLVAGLVAPVACKEVDGAHKVALIDPKLVDRIARSLHAEFGDALTPIARRAIAAAAVETFSTATVRTYVPILAHRRAAAEARTKLGASAVEA